jgi:hypothetical protein
MSITPPTGILDITDAIVRVSKLEFRGATGFDTILNNVARNTILLVDQNVEYTADKAWGLKLPNAWVSEFDAYWDSGASGNIDFNIYNNTTSGTNGYVISMDDTTITVTYDGGSALETVSLGSTLRNDTWRKIHILFERDMISLALDGTRVLYFKDTLIRPRVYDEESGYVIASGLSADRKVKNLRILNGDKWMTDNTSNIAFVHGNVGIGTTQAAYTLDVKGDIRATGNLLIEGLTTTVDTQNLSIEDAIVEIGRGNDGGTSGKDVGFLFTRNNGADTTNSNVALIYDESTDRLTFGYSDGSPTASTLAINTSKSLSVVIPSGNLGIGTASPSGKLDVATTGNPSTSTVNFTGLRLYNDNFYFSDTNELLFKHGSNTGQGQAKILTYLPGGNDVDMRFYTTNSGSLNTTPNLTLTGDGNVGIGTANPLDKLMVMNGTIRSHDAGNTTNIPGLKIRRRPATAGQSGSNYIECGQFSDVGNDSSGTDGNRFIVKNDGNVGIGTASPDNKLEIADHTSTNPTLLKLTCQTAANPGESNTSIQLAGTSAGNYGGYIEGYLDQGIGSGLKLGHINGSSAKNEYMRITNYGNVGIGTTNPTSKLYIQDDNADTKITIRGGGSTVNDANVTIELLETADSFYGGAIQYSGISAIQGLRFGHYVNSSTPRIDMVIDRGTGNVGIGTASPDGKLDIYTGSASTVALSFDRYASGNYRTDIYQNQYGPDFRVGYNTYTPESVLYLKRFSNGTKEVEINGNVGIGTTNPRCGLDVQRYGTRCSYPFGIGGSTTYASRIEITIGVGNNSSGWTKDLVAGGYERGGWIRVFSGATQSAGASSGAVQNPQEASFVYSIYGSYLYWSRVSGSTSITLSCPAYQTIRVNVSGGGSYPWGYIEAYQQGGIAIF